MQAVTGKAAGADEPVLLHALDLAWIVRAIAAAEGAVPDRERLLDRTGGPGGGVGGDVHHWKLVSRAVCMPVTGICFELSAEWLQLKSRRVPTAPFESCDTLR